MRFGYNPHLLPLNKRYFVQQLRRAIGWARELGLGAIELSCTEDMAALGLQNVFGGDFVETLLDVPDLRFHVHMYFGEHSVDEIGISDTNRRARAAYLRKLCSTIEYFERARPMQLYVLSSGPRIVETPAHIQALIGSLDCVRTLFPDLPLAVENGRPGTVLERATDFLDFLDVYTDTGFVFDTGWAFQAVGYSKDLFARFLRSVSGFIDRLVEVHWRNLGPGTKIDVPLHVPIERGVDLPLVAQLLGRNPKSVHLIKTAAVTEQSLLARDRRMLVRYLRTA